jgi:hypothetical protein
MYLLVSLLLLICLYLCSDCGAGVPVGRSPSFHSLILVCSDCGAGVPFSWSAPFFLIGLSLCSDCGAVVPIAGLLLLLIG